MNTTAAATQANVTVDTIRTWCRRGVVAAVKQAGKWVIDTASLAHRITIGTLKTRKPAAKNGGTTVATDDNATPTEPQPAARCCACKRPIKGRPLYYDGITGEPMHTGCWMRDNDY